MKKAWNYIALIASVIALAALVVSGIKLADHNYDVICEAWIMGVCLVVLFGVALYKLLKHKD